MYHIIFLVLLALIFPILSPFSEFILITLSVLEILLFLTFLILVNMFPIQAAVVIRDNLDEDDNTPPNIWGDNIICILLLGILGFFNYETLFCYMIIQMFAQNLFHQVVLFTNNILK